MESAGTLADATTIFVSVNKSGGLTVGRGDCFLADCLWYLWAFSPLSGKVKTRALLGWTVTGWMARLRGCWGAMWNWWSSLCATRTCSIQTCKNFSFSFFFSFFLFLFFLSHFFFFISSFPFSSFSSFLSSCCFPGCDMSLIFCCWCRMAGMAGMKKRWGLWMMIESLNNDRKNKKQSKSNQKGTKKGSQSTHTHKRTHSHKIIQYARKKKRKDRLQSGKLVWMNTSSKKKKEWLRAVPWAWFKVKKRDIETTVVAAEGKRLSLDLV